ncbi:MAG: polyprenyl synthetase family protein [Gammaproteobacteria bacterium]|jgi:farnesyl diphosphate synthase|nr:polyprenyl synthetase family protein [Gammaproteobacteria bacterium]MDP6617632.1 polyprenyl synthetase family protein [Gammaproteobacteria bacterium]MDP6694509.1 polyprenyl synthetase family protein [Gammaproteobacteria bacterium]MDP7041081.1 polyprenyl synthetase family protein [Gammaproteobacteria bacterium]
MTFEDYTRDWLGRAEAKLEAVLPTVDESPKRLHEAMRYSVMGGGKRVRPMLVYATGMSLDVPLVRLDGPAAAIELMHAFSLVHDDLPSMDDDDLRRGHPTTHKAFDEATAILAADALQPLAIHVLATDEEMQCNLETRLKLIELLASACGSCGMTGGQSLDLGAEGKQLSTGELEHMYRLKTGRLLHASVMSAVICADRNHPEYQALENYIDHLGLAFQIRDDILDIEGETETIGKQQGADIEKSKATWPALFGMEAARKHAAELLDKALTEIEILGPSGEPLRQVAHYIVDRTL